MFKFLDKFQRKVHQKGKKLFIKSKPIPKNHIFVRVSEDDMYRIIGGRRQSIRLDRYIKKKSFVLNISSAHLYASGTTMSMCANDSIILSRSEILDILSNHIPKADLVYEKLCGGSSNKIYHFVLYTEEEISDEDLFMQEDIRLSHSIKT